MRIIKDAKLSNENIKKNIDPTPVDLFGIVLNQMVDDFFDSGFVDECIDRLETHPETLYLDMDNSEIVNPRNVQSTL